MAVTPISGTHFITRAPIMSDVYAVNELVVACDIADIGEPDSSEESLRDDWQAAGPDLEKDAWLVLSADGTYVGYARLYSAANVRMRSFINVHPTYRGQGIEHHLLASIEQRAMDLIALAPPSARVVLQNIVGEHNTILRPLLEHSGYSYVRSTLGMAITLDAEPVIPQLPERITLRPFIPEQDDRAVHEALEEAFADHWGSVRRTFEEWRSQKMSGEQFDPSLWFLAVEGNEVVGGSLCANFLDMGVVNTLGVRRPWRRKGVAMALLLHSFRAFYRRGRKKVILGVDSTNLTGATRLYERAGMHVDVRFDTYQKELRTGEDMMVQGLTE